MRAAQRGASLSCTQRFPRCRKSGILPSSCTRSVNRDTRILQYGDGNCWTARRSPFSFNERGGFPREAQDQAAGPSRGSDEARVPGKEVVARRFEWLYYTILYYIILSYTTVLSGPKPFPCPRDCPAAGALLPLSSGSSCPSAEGDTGQKGC